MSPPRDPSFARNGESDPRGKLDERIDVPVPSSVKRHVEFLATASRLTSSQWVRKLITRELYGELDRVQTIVAGVEDGDGRNI